MPLPAGWYPVSGDPTGTQRYWDGDAFASGPRRDANARRKSGFIKPNSATKWRMASPMTRALARVIDFGSPTAVVLGIAKGMDQQMPELSVSGIAANPRLLIMIGAWILVNEVLLVGIWGVSLGRILMGLKVVDYRDQDRPPGLLRALLRLTLMVPGLVFTVMLFLLGQRRGIHDLAAGTAVVYA